MKKDVKKYPTSGMEFDVIAKAMGNVYRENGWVSPDKAEEAGRNFSDFIKLLARAANEIEEKKSEGLIEEV